MVTVVCKCVCFARIEVRNKESISSLQPFHNNINNIHEMCALGHSFIGANYYLGPVPHELPLHCCATTHLLCQC